MGHGNILTTVEGYGTRSLHCTVYLENKLEHVVIPISLLSLGDVHRERRKAGDVILIL